MPNATKQTKSFFKNNPFFSLKEDKEEETAAVPVFSMTPASAAAQFTMGKLFQHLRLIFRCHRR